MILLGPKTHSGGVGKDSFFNPPMASSMAPEALQVLIPGAWDCNLLGKGTLQMGLH